MFCLLVCLFFRQEHEIIATVPPRPLWAPIGKKLNIRGVYMDDYEFKTDEEFEFEFRENPTVYSVQPQEAIAL